MKNTFTPIGKNGTVRRGNVIYPDFGTKPQPAADPADMEEVLRYIHEKLRSAGIPADDPAFWNYARHAPTTSRKGKPNTLDTQIGWTLAHVKRFYDSFRQKRRAAQ